MKTAPMTAGAAASKAAAAALSLAEVTDLVGAVWLRVQRSVAGAKLIGAVRRTKRGRQETGNRLG